jgi:hypothetical protein
MFSESTCSGVTKMSNLFLCEHFWVNKSLSMMCLVKIRTNLSSQLHFPKPESRSRTINWPSGHGPRVYSWNKTNFGQLKSIDSMVDLRGPGRGGNLNAQFYKTFFGRGAGCMHKTRKNPISAPLLIFKTLQS